MECVIGVLCARTNVLHWFSDGYLAWSVMLDWGGVAYIWELGAISQTRKYGLERIHNKTGLN